MRSVITTIAVFIAVATMASAGISVRILPTPRQADVGGA